MVRGKSMESLMTMSPSSLPRMMFPFRVLMPAEVLNLLASNPCSLVQFRKSCSFVLKDTSSFSVLIISLSGR